MQAFPTTIIIFGITGDLARKKILPALCDLWHSGRLPDTRIVGFSRKEFSEEEILALDKSWLEKLSHAFKEFLKFEDLRREEEDN